ncbi:MAG: hypothetical protein R2710_04655 [Acidimicrobiales bacterium]
MGPACGAGPALGCVVNVACAARRPSTDQPAVRELGDELLRQAEAQRHDLPPIVDFDQDEIEAVLRRASQLGAHTHEPGRARLGHSRRDRRPGWYPGLGGGSSGG